MAGKACRVGDGLGDPGLAEAGIAEAEDVAMLGDEAAI